MTRTLDEKADPRQAALIIVDVQNDFCHPDGAAGRRGKDLSQIPSMIENLGQLLSGARRVGLPIIFIRAQNGPWTDSAAWLGRATSPTDPRAMSCLEDTWGSEFYAVAPRTDERVVVKHRYSAMLGTDLDLILRARGIRTLLLTGVSTNVCVESTTRDAYQFDYEVVLVADCCAAYSQADHDGTLRNVAAHFGDVVRSEAIIAAWTATATAR
jgi:ureidoacrylate peracid hydrolase